MSEKTSEAKTLALERMYLPIGQLEPNPDNPNEMSDAQFNMLCDNIESVGLTDPILVRKLDTGRYRIVGGFHRWEVAKLYDYTEVPVTVITDPNFTQDEEAFQLVRHNIIHGKMNPAKFIKLYETLTDEYAEDVAAELFGFTEEEDFLKLIQQVQEGLPPELQDKFEEAKSEIKTIDSLAKLLNHLFATYGDTLPYGYMILDYGGKESVWIRMQGGVSDLKKLATKIKESRRSLDSVIEALLHKLEDPEFFEQVVNSLAEVEGIEGTTFATQEELGNLL